MRFFAQGLRFSCKRCSACCRFEAGFVFLSKTDAFLLGTALNMDYNGFLENYCRWIPGENGKSRLSLKEKSNFDCIFWAEERGCSVYEARPLQCRTFPFWESVVNSSESWKMTAQDCPGMNQGDFYSEDLIKKSLAMRKADPVISRDA